jgi:uncharacterized protein
MNAMALWILAILLMVIGALGIVLPALPGVPLIFAGMVVAASIDDFQRIGWLTITVLGVLTVVGFVVDFAASALGAKRIGASTRAIWGAIIGTLIGLFFGIVGLIFGPFIGAVIGEITVHGRLGTAGRIGVATWVGLLFGTLVKLAIAFSMLGIFLFAYWID